MVQIIRKKLIYINNNIKTIEQHINVSYKEYENNIVLKKAIERVLQEISEGIIDIANHIIAKNNFSRPKSNKELFDTLINNNILPKVYKKTLYSLASFRNFIVHSYDKIDDKIVFNVARNNLKEIKEITNKLKEYKF